MNHDLTTEEIDKLMCHPAVNHDSIVVVRQPDGNYRGFAFKNGSLIQVRAGDPLTVLNLLITHNGEEAH